MAKRPSKPWNRDFDVVNKVGLARIKRISILMLFEDSLKISMCPWTAVCVMSDYERCWYPSNLGLFPNKHSPLIVSRKSGGSRINQLLRKQASNKTIKVHIKGSAVKILGFVLAKHLTTVSRGRGNSLRGFTLHTNVIWF